MPGSATDRQMVLVNEDATNITTISDMTSRTFTDYSKTAVQGDYIIISNPCYILVLRETTRWKNTGPTVHLRQAVVMLRSLQILMN